MPLMKSKSSIFNIRKRGKKAVDADSADLSGTLDGTQPGPADQAHQDGGEAARLLESMKQAQAAAQAAARAGKSKLVGAPPESMQFSEAANGYVPAESNEAYPGGIKVLGMHSNVMEFATAPAWVTDLPKPPHHTPTLEEVTPLPDDDDEDDYKERDEEDKEDDDDDDHAIEDAPIYSPSLGDLSQYARPSPPPAQPVTGKEKQPEPDTPTRAPAEGQHRRRLGLRKSKSGLALLGLFNKGPKEPKEEGALQERANNQKEGGHRQLKKSRSMNLAALLKKGDSTAKKGPLLRENSGLPSQPTKPSPLRYEALMEEDDEKVEEPLTPQAGFKRTLPRRQLTPADRAKRMGIVGVPEEYEPSQQ